MPPILKNSFAASIVLALSIPAQAQAVEFTFDWTGQIAGFSVSGGFGYDETQNYTDGIVRTGDLDYLDVSFFSPDGNLLQTYEDNHLDPGVNFNFDTNIEEILQSGSYNEPDGLSIGAINYDRESGNDPAMAEGLTFWSKPPRSDTPHLHVDDWANEFGFPIGFSSHEDVAFPTRTTQERIDTGRVGEAYLPPNGEPVTPLDEPGQFAQVTRVPEPLSTVGLLGLSGYLLTTRLKRRQRVAG
ncbi:MAG: PEP-CTERM sorting domain-containing protein [Cyanobacteria bacterium J06632_22]